MTDQVQEIITAFEQASTNRSFVRQTMEAIRQQLHEHGFDLILLDKNHISRQELFKLLDDYRGEIRYFTAIIDKR